LRRSTAKTSELPRSLERYPEHAKIAENIVNWLRADRSVLGVYLSGSFATGKPDRYSDLDFYLLVRTGERERVKREHANLRSEVGELISEFPATHLGDPNQVIALYRATYPVHVDYLYRTTDEVVPNINDREVVILWDSSGELTAWKRKCFAVRDAGGPRPDELQYFEDRFWTWCIYADSKIRRGELWEARDMIEYLRNRVIVALMTCSSSLPFEGNRRIESKFAKGAVLALKSTLQTSHSREGYAKALEGIADLYVRLVNGLLEQFRIKIERRDAEAIRRALRR